MTRASTRANPTHVTLLLLAAVTAICTTANARQIEGQAPDLEIVGFTVDDTAAGNGDGGLHPGEEAEIAIYLSNRGSAPAFNVAGTISEVDDHPGVEILDGLALWPDMPPGGTPAASTDQVRLRVATTRPCLWEIPLRLEITADNGYLVTRELTLTMIDPQSTDLAEGKARPFYFGADADDQLGYSIAAGDLDGDGFDDLVLGAIFGNGPSDGRGSAGEVAVVYGGPTPSGDVDLNSPPAGVALVYGADAGDMLGVAVAAGDLDGDGFDDLVLGSPFGHGPANVRFESGEVAVIYGGPTRLGDIDLASPPAGVAFVYGADASDFFGTSAAVGDLDGDGYGDLVLGADRGAGPFDGRGSAGEITVIYGGPTRPGDVDLASPPGGVAFVYGADAADLLGQKLAVGDLDGDGYDDAIAGAKGGDGPAGGRSGAGEVVVVYGGPMRLGDIDLASNPGGVSVVYGAAADDGLGDAVAAGDLDGDGFGDLILGAEQADGPDDGRGSAGEVAVVHGGPTRPGAVDLASPPAGVDFVYGAAASDFLGSAVAAGDVDGDGFDDLVLGVLNGDGPADGRAGAGEVAVVHGGPTRSGDLDLASTPPGVVVVYGADSIDQLGVAVATGDLDGDGFDELLLGAHVGDGPSDNRPAAGEVAVLPGAPRSRYRYDADAYSFIDATSGDELVLGCDDCGVPIPIGFVFDFYGRTYDQVTVSSNGYLTFGSGPGGQPGGVCPPSATAPDDLIAVFWDDLDLSAGGAVYSVLEGVAPERRLTVLWQDVPVAPGVGAATFEVTLFETSDQILMQYQDVDFGGTPSDFGANAVAGVEGATGANGTALHCMTADLAAGAAYRFRRFANPTVVYRDDVEPGTGNWEFDPLWHRANLDPQDCGVASRSGAWSWYYGQDATCDYDTGATNAGLLGSDALLADMQQDAALSFWHRRDTEDLAAYDQSHVRIIPSGEPAVTLTQVVEDGDAWVFSDDFIPFDPLAGRFAPLDLSSFVGEDVRLQFGFDTVDEVSNGFLGWMVDDVEIRACPVYDAGDGGLARAARSTAHPAQICDDAPGRVDALGSYCTACPSLEYQWSRDGAPLAGATGVSYDIPVSDPPGTYDYSVEISCPANPGCSDVSGVSEVGIVEPPAEVGPTLTVDKFNGGADLGFQWADVAGADDYVLRSDPVASGPFDAAVGVASSGASPTLVPTPAGDLVFFVVVARNAGCGEGAF